MKNKPSPSGNARLRQQLSPLVNGGRLVGVSCQYMNMTAIYENDRASGTKSPLKVHSSPSDIIESSTRNSLYVSGSQFFFSYQAMSICLCRTLTDSTNDTSIYIFNGNTRVHHSLGVFSFTLYYISLLFCTRLMFFSF